MDDDKINKLEIKFAVMENKMENVERAMIEMKDSFDKFCQKADEKYADKWVERFVWVAVTASVGSLVVALAKIIFK